MARGMVLQLCRTQLECEQIEGAATGAAGLTACRSLQPDIVLLDLDLPDVSGLDLIAPLAEASPRSKVIVLSAHTEDYAMHRCLEAGVDGFVDKNDEPAESIIEAVEAVRNGRSYFSPAMTRVRAAMRHDPAAFSKLLTKHEQDLLVLFGQGLSNEDIATRLNLSPRTVGNHRHNIMAKLRIPSTPELMRYALKKGFTRLRDAT